MSKTRSASEVAAHDYRTAFLKSVRWISSASDVPIKRACILVIGCGYNYPDPLLWSSTCSLAVGADVRTAFWKRGIFPLAKELSRSGTNTACALARAIILRRAYHGYYDELRDVSGLDLDETRQQLITYDGRNLPFSDKSFDVIVSNAVLEHVSDLDCLSREMARVAADGGVCYHLWHNYYSLSGSHVPEDLARIRPWGHLTGDTEVANWLRASGTYLNKKLPTEIEHTLAKDFNQIAVHKLDKDHRIDGIDRDYEREGEELLSPELEKTIGSYSRDVLLTRAYAFLGKKNA